MLLVKSPDLANLHRWGLAKSAVVNADNSTPWTTAHRKKNNSRSICSTSDVPSNRRNIHHRSALLWRFSWFWRRIQNCWLTYLFT